MKILFVGNSHTYVNDMPQIVKMNACEAIDVMMLARPGITFATHLEDPSLQFALKQDVDVVIYQQAAHIPCPSKEETLRDGKKLVELARKYGKKVYVLKPWPRQEDREGFKVICDIYETLSKENQVTIIDAGSAIVNMEENCYLKDGEHLNPLGSYVEACSILNSVFSQTSFKGLTLDMYNPRPFDAIELNENQKANVEKVIKQL